jgi:hypothetical protein
MRQQKKKTEKDFPLVVALKQYWRRVEFVAIPIGHAGTTLETTLDHLNAAFSTVRPRTDLTSTSEDTSQPDTDYNARSHDYCLFKSMLDALTDLAQSRLLGINSNKKLLVGSLSRAVGRSRAHPTALPQHAQIAAQQKAATHTHRPRTTRVPEDTAIT